MLIQHKVAIYYVLSTLLIRISSNSLTAIGKKSCIDSSLSDWMQLGCLRHMDALAPLAKIPYSKVERQWNVLSNRPFTNRDATMYMPRVQSHTDFLHLDTSEKLKQNTLCKAVRGSLIELGWCSNGLDNVFGLCIIIYNLDHYSVILVH